MEKSLTNIQWGEFYLKDVFNEIQRGKRLKKEDHKLGKLPYISSTSMNNGVDSFVGNKDNVRLFSNCLTLANSGSVGSTFFQPFLFVASDHVTKLSNSKFNRYVYLFIATTVKKLGEKYSFNREINDNRIRKEKILLPMNEQGEPDYVFMEQYMREKEQQLVDKYKKHLSFKINGLECFCEGGLLANKAWGEFKIKNLFKVSKGVYLPTTEVKVGSIPYITAKSENNGLNSFIGNKVLFKGNAITVEKVGLSAYYQPKDFYCSHDVTVISSDFINKYNAEFICSMINRQGYKYSYGRQAQMNVVRSETILLPVNGQGEPDYLYMENYMKRLECQKLSAYLAHKNSS